MFTIDYRIFSQIISIQLKYIQAPRFFCAWKWVMLICLGGGYKQQYYKLLIR